MIAPERIYLDGDVEVGDGVFPRCFENPKYASEPPVEYIRADLGDPLSDPRVKALVEAAKDARILLAEHEPHPLPVLGRLLAAILALDPAAIAAKLKGDGNERA